MSFHRFLGKLVFGREFRNYLADCDHPQEAQKRAWRRIRNCLSQGKYWTSKYSDFHGRKLEDFEISDYETYREVLEIHADDLYSPFSGEKILFWSESSGTTGQSKIYPITRAYQAEFQMVNGPFLYQVIKKNLSFLKHKTAYFAATHPSRKTKSGVGVGFISAYNYAHIPFLFKVKYVFPDEVFCDRQTFFKWGALYALSQKMDTLVAITPSMIERFFSEIDVNREFYKSQIKKPTPPKGFPFLRFKSNEVLRLAKVLSQPQMTLQDLWPDLRTLICWKSATCGLQLKNISPILKGVSVLDAPYSATEGWMTVPFGTSEAGGALHCGGHVYEFIEVGAEVKRENLVKPWQLEARKYYEVFLTTSMGFVRFRLRDIVYCKEFFRQSPVLEFHEKEGQSISIGHTRVSDVHLVKALNLGGINIPSPWFVICASDAKKLFLVTCLEPDESSRIVTSLDRALRQSNEEYEDDRREGLLGAIEHRVLSLEHELWRRADHAQAKPKLIMQGSLE